MIASSDITLVYYFILLYFITLINFDQSKAGHCVFVGGVRVGPRVRQMHCISALHLAPTGIWL